MTQPLIVIFPRHIKKLRECWVNVYAKGDTVTGTGTILAQTRKEAIAWGKVPSSSAVRVAYRIHVIPKRRKR